MVSDQVQVGGQRRLFLDEIQQVVGGAAWEGQSVSGVIIPNGNTSGAAGTDAGLTFVAVCPCALCLLEFDPDFIC